MHTPTTRTVLAILGATISTVGSSLLAACGDSSGPIAPRTRTVSLAKGPTPSGPNALPERGRIVFQRYAATNSSRDLYSINEDGSGLKRLTYSEYDDLLPAGSRDGKKIAYVAQRNSLGQADIVIMNADGSLPKTLTASGLYSYMFGRMEWSPDGKRIAIALNPSGDLIEWDIYMVNATTGALTRVTSAAGAELNPTWSPDGSRIAFDMSAGAFRQVFTMNPDGTGVTQFTFCSADCRQPSWSPDGGTIAVYDAASSLTIPRSVSDWTIAAGWFMGTNATWAPDGARLAYQSLDPGTVLAFQTVSYNGSDIRPLMSTDGGATIATWLRK